MLFQMIMQVKDWLRRKEEGQGLVEYALIILLVSIVVIVVLVLLGEEVAAVFQSIVNVFKEYPAP